MIYNTAYFELHWATGIYPAADWSRVSHKIPNFHATILYMPQVNIKRVWNLFNRTVCWHSRFCSIQVFSLHVTTIHLPDETQQQPADYTVSVMVSTSWAPVLYPSLSKHQPSPWECAASAVERICKRDGQSLHWPSTLLGLPCSSLVECGNWWLSHGLKNYTRHEI